ncbi:MAG TPA: cysteine ABC transporter ATP-binding protein [Eggerthellaceae bacterium]|nr:cysteine ABC transporter ATP-binding protein [Eggerthellaceae bacterium]
MIKTRLIGLLSHARMYIVYQVLWQWAALICQIGVIFIVTGLLRLLLQGQLTEYWMVLAGLLLAVLLAIRFWCDRRATFNSFAASVDVKRIIRGRIYEKLLRLGASYKEHVSTAEVVQMSVEGAEQLETYFGKYLSQLFYSLLAPITLFAALVWYNWQASLVLLACVPLIPIVIMVVQKIARRLLSRYWDVYTGLGDSFLENLQGLTTLKIYRADALKADEMDAESERFRRITMKVLSMQLNSIIIMDVVAYGGAAAGMAVAIWQFMQGNVDVAGVLMIILLSAEFFIPMRLLGSFFHIAMNGMAASDKMFAFLDIDEPEAGDVQLAGEPTGISFNNVTFGYDPESTHRVLDDVCMEFPPGSFVSLVGESGCGKSTAARIITGRNRGYYGSVMLGDAELGSIAEDSLARDITMVTNESYLFKGTVMDNLAIGNPNAGRDDMRRALQAVNLADYLDTQHGLDTQLDEGASNLSGGQRQRLALARALLHDSPCYIFDEATSNIDAESEEDIMRVVHELARTKTVILISHRLANVVDSDCIYLLADGKVAQAGTHEQLMAAGGAYANLFQSQRALETYGRKAVA